MSDPKAAKGGNPQNFNIAPNTFRDPAMTGLEGVVAAVATA
ncbi:MAG: hypothetical protein ABL892_12735 [Thiobacillaceae bacterium]